MPGITENRSDDRAKGAFISKYLIGKMGYSIDDIGIIQAPADIKVTKGGKTTYYEIKSTIQEEKYFGAATITEWRAALEHPDNYYFVVVIEKEKLEDFNFLIFTPDEFLEYSTIPPFKVYFNINLTDLNKKTNHKTAIGATRENLRKLIEYYDSIKD